MGLHASVNVLASAATCEPDSSDKPYSASRCYGDFISHLSCIIKSLLNFYGAAKQQTGAIVQ